MSSITSNSVEIIFEKSGREVSGAKISYQVEQQVKNSTDWQVAESSVESTDDDHIVVIVVTGLESETLYRFRVVAVLYYNGQTFNGIPSEPSEFRKTKSGKVSTNRVKGAPTPPFTVRRYLILVLLCNISFFFFFKYMLLVFITKISQLIFPMLNFECYVKEISASIASSVVVSFVVVKKDVSWSGSVVVLVVASSSVVVVAAVVAVVVAVVSVFSAVE